MLTPPPSNPVVTFASFCQMSPSASIPRNAGSWDNATSKAIPFRYPSLMGLDSSPVMAPSFRAEPASMITPINTANSPASATDLSLLPAASGTIAAAIMGARDESGPKTRMRDGPTTA